MSKRTSLHLDHLRPAGAAIGALGFMLATAPTTTMAQEASTSDGRLEEIVVTAQKREERLQDAALAVSALSAERLMETGTTSFQQMQSLVPSLTFASNFGYANLFVRGLGLNSFFANIDPSVALYVDGAVVSQPSAQLMSMFDLERVELLRGPQGTLYGRNSTGGLVNLITAKPTQKLDGYARATFGNYQMFKAEAAVGGPLTDRLSGRIAYQGIKRDGYAKNIVTGNDVDDLESQAMRAQLAFDATDRLSFLLSGEYASEDDAANALYFKRVTFPNPPVPTAAAPGIGGFPPNKRDYASNVDPQNDRETWSTTLTIDADINDHFSIKNVANYRELDTLLVQDLDLSSVVTSSIQYFPLDSEQYSEEFQILFNFDRLTGIAGLYYFSEDVHHRNEVGRTPTGDAYPGGQKRVRFAGEGETRSKAAFWNVKYSFTDAFALKVGGRYTDDHRRIDNTGLVFIGPIAAPTLLASASADSKGFTNYNTTAGVEWHPTRDVLAYYTYADGFKAGTGQLGSTTARIIDPETIKSHEVGLKTTWLGGGLVANFAAYTYEAKDIQLDQTLPTGAAGFTTQFRNATSQDAWGVELESNWAVTDGLELGLSVVHQETEFGSFLTVDPINPLQFVPGVDALTDIDGKSARSAPEWSGAFNIQYRLPLSIAGALSVSADYSYKGEQFFSEFNNELLRQGAYSLIAARLKYESSNGRWTTELWGNNLADELIETTGVSLGTGRVTARAFYPPRTYGITFGYKL